MPVAKPATGRHFTDSSTAKSIAGPPMTSSANGKADGHPGGAC